MRKSVYCLSAVLLLSSSAFAGVCENAVKGAERKVATAKSRCENQTQISRLKERLAKAKTDKTKASVQKLIDKAVAKQQNYCKQQVTSQATVDKIKGFCSIAAAANTSYCKFGYSLRVKGSEASSRCKRGRLWSGEKQKCYYIEEYYYTGQNDFNNGKSTGRGEILYSGQAEGSGFFQINVGFLLDNVKKETECK